MEILKEKCFYVVLTLLITTVGLLIFTHYEIFNTKKLVEEVEFYDSLNNYNKIYYETSFNILKKENRQLYDSLKQYKDKITYLVQFTHEKEYNSGNVHSKPTVIDSVIHDTITIEKPLIAKTYEYVSEPNDTFQYKLHVNSYLEPNWFQLQAKVKNKFTIVNKEENGMNHIVISDGTNNGTIGNVTVYKKKQSVWKRFSFGPSATAGYDPINRQWGVVFGVGGTFNLNQ